MDFSVVKLFRIIHSFSSNQLESLNFVYTVRNTVSGLFGQGVTTHLC